MFRQVILKSRSIRKGINVANNYSAPETTIPATLHEVNIVSLKNIVESIRKIKNR